MRVGAVDGRERRRAEDAGVHAAAGERAHKRQRTVDPAAPQHLPANELLGMVRFEPGLAFAVAGLLPPVALHGGAVVMPDQRRRRKADGVAARLQAPADVDVVAGAQVDRIEAADRLERRLPERHVAARHVFGDAIVEQHVGRAAGGASDGLRDPGVVGRRDVGPAGPRHGAVQHRLHQIREPVGVDAHVGVGVGHDLAGGVGDADVASRGETAVGNADQPHGRVASRDRGGVIARAVVDDDHLEVGIGQRLQRAQAAVDGVAGVVGADHHRDARPRLLRGGGEGRLGEDAGNARQRRLRSAFAIDQSERPVIHLVPAAPPLVGPGKGHRTGGAFGEGRLQLRRGQPGLAVEPFANAVGAGFGQQQRLGAGQVLQTPEIRAQIALAVQVDVEGAHVEAGEVEVFGGREVRVGEQRRRRRRLRVVVELAEEALDARRAVPAHHTRRDLVAHGEEQRGGMRRQATHIGGHLAPDAPCQRGVVEEGDVLHPRQPDHQAQALRVGGVEHLVGRRRVGADGVDAGRRHGREVGLHAGERGVLAARGVRCERAVGHALHEKASATDFQELPADARVDRHVIQRTGQTPILSRPRRFGGAHPGRGRVSLGSLPRCPLRLLRAHRGSGPSGGDPAWRRRCWPC